VECKGDAAAAAALQVPGGGAAGPSHREEGITAGLAETRDSHPCTGEAASGMNDRYLRLLAADLARLDQAAGETVQAIVYLGRGP
jgi:hypothetical protein